MIDISNKDSSGNALLLEMALQAERVVTLVQHSLVDRAVRRMAVGAIVGDRRVRYARRIPQHRLRLRFRGAADSRRVPDEEGPAAGCPP